MFNNLLAFWKGKDFLTNVVDEFGNMLKVSQEMFGMVCGHILKGRDTPGLKDKIYDVDKNINLIEKEIRKRIIEHLSISPSVDTPMCLLLMSVVKDAERLGDYAKNLFERSRVRAMPLDAGIFSGFFGDMDKTIAGMFDNTKKAFIDSDEDAAKNIWQIERSVVKRCDKILEEIAKSNLPADKAVAFTLVARYFKRIAAHLTNIATSVILPISEIDFFDEKRKSDSE